MRKTISITEFQRYCRELKPSTYRFAEVNQEGGKRSKYLNQVGIFKTIEVCLSPNTIILVNGNSYMSFHRVKYIIQNDSDIPGEVFDIVCGNKKSDNEDEIYRIVVC